jgi:hypothetical protein
VFRHFWLDTQLFQTRHGPDRGLLYHLTMSLANACSHALKDRLGSPDRVYLTTSASETKFCYRLVIPLAPPTYYKRVPDRSESTTIYRTLSPPRSPVHPITTIPIFFSLYLSLSSTLQLGQSPSPHAGPYTTHTPYNRASARNYPFLPYLPETPFRPSNRPTPNLIRTRPSRDTTFPHLLLPLNIRRAPLYIHWGSRHCSHNLFPPPDLFTASTSQRSEPSLGHPFPPLAAFNRPRIASSSSRR